MCFAKSKELSKLIGKYPKQNLGHFDLYQFEHEGESIMLYVSHKRARKSTHVQCLESGDIVWEQFYPFGGMSRPSSEKKYALKPIFEKNSITIIIIRGTPGNITGLDNGIFNSHFTVPQKGQIYLMTEKKITKFWLTE